MVIVQIIYAIYVWSYFFFIILSIAEREKSLMMIKDLFISF